jgi:hypothetical protein
MVFRVGKTGRVMLARISQPPARTPAMAGTELQSPTDLASLLVNWIDEAERLLVSVRDRSNEPEFVNARHAVRPEGE